MTEPELRSLDERLAQLREATDIKSAPHGLEARVLAALSQATRWESALQWCRRALVLSAFATVSVIALAAWHDARLTNRVAIGGVADDGPIGDP
jgi:hypothetical protein